MVRRTHLALVGPDIIRFKIPYAVQHSRIHAAIRSILSIPVWSVCQLNIHIVASINTIGRLATWSLSISMWTAINEGNENRSNVRSLQHSWSSYAAAVQWVNWVERKYAVRCILYSLPRDAALGLSNMCNTPYRTCHGNIVLSIHVVTGRRTKYKLIQDSYAWHKIGRVLVAEQIQTAVFSSPLRLELTFLLRESHMFQGFYRSDNLIFSST